MALARDIDTDDGLLFLHETSSPAAREQKPDVETDTAKTLNDLPKTSETPSGVFSCSDALNAAILGERLRQAREGRGLAVSDVAQTLNFQCNVIQALEDGKLESLPTSYEVGFFRTYAQYLGDKALGCSLKEAVDVVRGEFKPQTMDTGYITIEEDDGDRAPNWVVRIALVAIIVIGAIVMLAWPQGHAGEQPEGKNDIPYRYSDDYNRSE